MLCCNCGSVCSISPAKTGSAASIAGKAGVVIGFSTVVAVFAGVVFLGETLSAGDWACIAAILIGVAGFNALRMRSGGAPIKETEP